MGWHKGSRIWILWKPNLFDIQFSSYSAQHIHMLVHSRVDDKKFQLTMIYAFNGLHERIELWNTLKDISATYCTPWLWLGDFNTVMSPIERLGGNTTDAEMEHFQDCVSICGMEDIPATGAMFTWSNKQEVNDRVYSRLDRAMGNQEWLDDYATSLAHFHPEGLFDHCPCTIVDRNADIGGKKNFKYFNMWGLAPSFKDSITMAWATVYRGTKIMALEHIQKALIDNPGDLDLIEEVALAHEPRDLVSQGRFYASKSQKYYQGLLGSTNTTTEVNVNVVRKGTVVFTHWDILDKPVTIEEVKNSIFSIPKNKSPGPDGYKSQFFRDAWDVIGTMMLALILPDIISKNQGAFVKGRSILENILICQDLVRLYHRGNASPRCMFKLDLQKAYDSIEWAFVDQMLGALMFPEKFRQMIMTCITTSSFTLNINGAQFGYFKGRRGLRQGDPISPLIFCICMEYLTRIMDFATRKWYFRFHPLCKSLKLTHLLFADDLLMFSKVTDSLKTDIIQVSGYQEGKLPFKYLGIPIQPGRLNKADCSVLVEKIVSKIRGIGARKLSYADYNRAPLVSWHDVCFSKKEGGLGIQNAGVWNVASVSKLVHWLYTKADRLWVLWIDHVYMKGTAWVNYQPPPDSNWNWRNICRVRGLLEGGYQGNTWIAFPGGYTVSAGYHWMQGSHPPVLWYKDVWDNWLLPKHSFIAWLIQKKALNTICKLHRIGICLTDRCILCEVGEETHDHLFDECVYSSRVIAGVEERFHISFTGSTQFYSKLRRKTCRMARMVTFYMIWQERNNCRLTLQISRPETLVSRISQQVHNRLVAKMSTVVKANDCGWLSRIHIRCNFCT
ncbi:uncharacterized protein LOC141601908 [Silene latifolia]|uniref:uncharacterized protein LOC141601908 n=1 Tax=Silene latifolia TaxID=37657 RepID=UPI003D76DACB